MNIDNAIEEVRQQLINIINQSGLPIQVTRLILLELQMMVNSRISAIPATPSEEGENGSDTHSK